MSADAQFPPVPCAPVAMLVFNRPEHTARVFAAVRRARPTRLFVVADGPRAGRAGEGELCERTRRVFDGVDWPCDVVRIFSATNLGCRKRVGSGISAVFEQVESCIFLEDDCLPDPTFFSFCTELLERYKSDERICAISGDGFTSELTLGNLRFEHSYYFTRYIHIWGWATWRRAWAKYDPAMPRWPKLRDTRWLPRLLGSRADALFWKLWFEMAHDGRLNTWDIPWVFNCWSAGPEPALAICPSRNLVSNIGFDGSGTHLGLSTSAKKPPLAELPTHPMDFPLSHPPEVARHAAADAWTQRFCYTGTLRKRWKRFRRYLRLGIKAPA